jgi:hypothetical protein
VKEKPFPFRFVEVHGARYLRLEDVAAFLRELGGSEETDVRKRLDEAACRITIASTKPRRITRKVAP